MENLIINKKRITNMIYEIRGKQVMLDSDLANLYNVETKRINEAVKRNPRKFPERFCFKLTDEESNNFLVAICDQKINIETRGGKYKNPTVFTEQGVAMLATILTTKVAVETSIAIMDAFVLMNKYISNELLEINYMKMQILNNSEKIDKNIKSIKLLQESFDKFEEKKKNNEIYFDGQIYDAYSKIIDILKEAKQNLIIIDNYADKTMLDMIRNIDVNTTIICKKDCLLKEIDIEKYRKQYNNLRVLYNNTFHDRYIILDKKIIYHCGASLNHIGSKTFSINKLEDREIIDALINKIKSC